MYPLLLRLGFAFLKFVFLDFLRL
jgi:hypothetical protein